MLRVLMVEDSEDDAALLEHHLRAQWPGLEVRRVDTLDGMREALKSDSWDIVLSDYSLPSLTALDALRILQETALDIPFLVVSGTINEEVAVEVLRAGAMDFLSKGRWARLAPAIDRERREARTRRAKREAERHLTDVLERAAFAQQAAGVGTWEYDLRSHVNIWSPVCEALHGLGEATYDGSGEAFLKLVHPGDLERVLAHCAALATLQGEHQLTYRVVWPDRSVHWVSARGRTFTDESGVVVRAAGIALDVTGQQELEANLRQAHKMESVGNLAGGIAHDFNNLLTVIIGYGDMLAERFAEDREAVADLAEILRAAKSAAVMTRQLLAFSRRQVLRPQVVDLNGTVSDLRTMLHRLIEANVRMSVRLTTELTPVCVDPGQIEQVLLNLVVNARDAMPNGGDLTIETAVVRIREADLAALPGLRAGEHVRLTVRDTGSGIPPAVRSRIFEPFFTTKEVGRGTGLGLATVYGIVQQSGGTIAVESEPGAGTAFTIYLPVSAVAASTTSRPSPHADAPLQQSFVMLVVEDDPHLRTFCERVIRELSGIPLTAASAEEAEAVCRAHSGRIDAALIDVMMPGVGGTVFGEWMRSQYPDTRLIYTSGYSPDDLSRRGMGPDDAFIGKPFTKATLLAALRTTLPPAREDPPRNALH